MSIAAVPPGSTAVPARWLRYPHYLRNHPRAVDVAVVVILAALSFPGSRVSISGVAVPSEWPGWLVTGGACGALMWHRGRPRVTAAVVIACATAVTALGYVLTPLLLAPAMLALYSLAVRTSQKTGYAFACTAIAVVICTGQVAGPAGESLVFKTFGPIEWLLLPVPLAVAARTRQAYLEAVHARAEYAERTRETEARHRVAEERMRIARELHDVVTHHLALAHAQASAAAHLMRADAAKAADLVANLADTTSSALRELKATVGLLRQESDAEAPVEPAPGLARLPDLAASLGEVGLGVMVAAEGDQRPLPAGVDLTAFRIIQEALTNVAKHAPGSQARVLVGYGADRLSISVSNEASVAGPSAGSGYGLIGMHERALSAGGWLRAGYRLSGGFEVAAELPLFQRGAGEPPAT